MSAELDARLGHAVAEPQGIAPTADFDWAGYGAACRSARGRPPRMPDPAPFLRLASPVVVSPTARQRVTRVPSSEQVAASPRRSSGPSRPSPATDRAAKAAIAAALPPRRSAAARAVRAGAPPSRVGPFVRRGLFGAFWRLSLVTAGLCVTGTTLRPPVLPAIAVVGGGIVLGFWHRRWGVARIWRWAVVAAAVAYVTPALGAAYGQTVAAALGLGATTPWIGAWRRVRA